MKAVNDILAQIKHFAKIVSQEPDATALCDRLAEELVPALAAAWAMVGIVRQNEISSPQIHYDPQQSPNSAHDEASMSLVKRVIATRRIYSGENAIHEPLLIVPVLNHQDNLLAVMACCRQADDKPFSPAQVDQLHTIAMLTVSGFERAQMFNKMVQWNNSFENLLAFNAALNAPVSLDTVLKRLVEHAAGLLGAEAGFTALLQNNDLWTDGYWHDRQWHPLQHRWTAESIPERVRTYACPHLTNDYLHDMGTAAAPFSQYEIRNLLCIPILNAQDKAIGCISVHNKHGGDEPFTWSDVALLEALGSSTALVLDNARLLNELEEQRAQLKALAARNIDLLEEERQRIARELHDEAGQILIGIKLGLQVLRHRLLPEQADLCAEIDSLRTHVNESTQQLKAIAYALRPPTLDKLGLEAALRQLAAEFEKRCSIHIHYETTHTSLRLPSDVETACYRIVQEALTNIARHADADQAWLTVKYQFSRLSISIQDDGRGFDPLQCKSAGLGLLGMQERTITLGGDFHIHSEIGKGSSLLVEIPFTQGV
ncbi:MAG: GAF domain-containing protein [Anaerolineae bacterium]